ncbi:GNAT family N-acetyltransferase [Saccharospirillum mangrovi]|uniref:GNAT family N-acetyltransferase n=1 Tax=Saccharospirillum mangrovi TaxID=2161747 RepID=UPI0013008CE1|nr:GNAT family N-acetyltransferase [Saccharospirillum mangrovi]
MQILTTARLTLRHQLPTDIDFLINLWSDPSITQYTGGPRDVKFLRNIFQEIAQNPEAEEFDLWPLVLNADNTLVGYAGLLPKEIDGETYVEVNYFIDSNRQGKGYAVEIGRKLVEYGFNDKDQTSLIAVIDPNNKASIRVAEKIGMTFWKNENRSGQVKAIYRIDRPT